MKKWFLFIIVISFQLNAQDTIGFVDGRRSAVKVNEIGLKEIKYNRPDNPDGPVYVVDKSEIKYIKYANGSVDSFAVKKPAEVIVTETPAYVENTPKEPSFEKILIIHKRLYYQHHGLNERGLLEIVREHPNPETKTIMLREYSKIRIYKNNRIIALCILGVGITAQLQALGSNANSSGPLFLLGGAAGITGSILATINKNKRKKKLLDIAYLYNGDKIPGKLTK